MIKRVMGKFSGMRKEQDFIVYPYKLDQTSLLVQSDRAIARIDIKTGRGLLNWRGSHSKYGVHLNPALGAEEYQFPAEFVFQCLEAQPGSGQRIGSNVFIA